MLVIIHSGETGVERGAHHGARAAGFSVAGYMPADRRDELGKIPEGVHEHLTLWDERSRREALIANIDMARAVILLVPDAAKAARFPATRWLLTELRSAKRSFMVVDPSTDLDEVASWVWGFAKPPHQLRLLVTGPRSTRWQQGEALGRRLIAALAMAEPAA